MRRTFAASGLALVVLALLLVGCPRGGDGETPEAGESRPAAQEPGQAATHQILIRVDTERGRFLYLDATDTTRSMERVYVNAGNRVEWISEQGPWAVHPAPLSPLNSLRVQGVQGEPAGATVRDGLPYGKYPYLVAVYIDGRVWTDDPTFESGPD